MTSLTEEPKYEVRNRLGERLPPGTYFVLRSSDRLAYAALWQYAQVLQLATEIGTLTDVERETLRSLRDMVEGMAESWQAAGGTIPD